MNDFVLERKINWIVWIGIVDYLFLLWVYIVINDKELLDILLMVINIVRELSLSEG